MLFKRAAVLCLPQLLPQARKQSSILQDALRVYMPSSIPCPSRYGHDHPDLSLSSAQAQWRRLDERNRGIAARMGEVESLENAIT